MNFLLFHLLVCMDIIFHITVHLIPILTFHDRFKLQAACFNLLIVFHLKNKLNPAHNLLLWKSVMIPVAHASIHTCVIMRGCGASYFTGIPEKMPADRCSSHLTDRLTQPFLCCMNAASSRRQLRLGISSWITTDRCNGSCRCPVSCKWTPLCRRADVTQPSRRALLRPSSHLPPSWLHSTLNHRQRTFPDPDKRKEGTCVHCDPKSCEFWRPRLLVRLSL